MENIFRIELNFAGIFILITILWLFNTQIKIKNRENICFLVQVYVTMAELILDSVFWIVDRQVFPLARIVNLSVNTVYYALQILQCYLWMRYCEMHLQYAKNRIRDILMKVFLILGLLLLVLNLVNGGVFTVNSDNVYRRSWGVLGTLEAVLCFVFPMMSIFLTVYRIRKGKSAEGETQSVPRGLAYLLLVSLIPVISAVIQMLTYGLNFIWVGMAMALLLVFLEIEVKQFQKLEKEVTEQKINIMLSQIQPHFLYNALSSITELCEEDPQSAKKATIDFSNFLRGNMASLSADQPISFEQELNHTRCYLELEKLRFSDKLTVVYNLQVMDFRIPTLSLQPIVENAVRYGVTKRREGGIVTITTEETPEDYVVTIEDNGIGFDPMQPHEDGRTHVGITNVRDRIARMSRGTLTITSKQGVGTKAVIRIPR